MKTALIYSGQARTIAQTWENHKWYLRKFPNPDIFVSVADDAQADDMHLLQRAFPHARFEMEKVVQPDIAEPPECSAYHSGYPRSVGKQGVLKQLFSLNRAWEFFGEKAKRADYDLIVRVRPDIAFCRLQTPWDRYTPDNREPENLRAALNHDLRQKHGHYIARMCMTPRWAKWGGLNDRFAILGLFAAEAYFTTFQRRTRLWELGCPFHPEQMIAASLELDDMFPDDSLKAEFISPRLPSPEHPNGGFYSCDVSTVDVMDAADRRY